MPDNKDLMRKVGEFLSATTDKAPHLNIKYRDMNNGKVEVRLCWTDRGCGSCEDKSKVSRVVLEKIRPAPACSECERVRAERHQARDALVDQMVCELKAEVSDDCEYEHHRHLCLSV